MPVCLMLVKSVIKKRTREATTCESKKRKKHKPSKKSRFKTLYDDDWVFCNNQQKNVSNNKAAIKNDIDMMIMKKLLQRSSGDSLFPRAQFLPQVGVFVLPYTIPF